MDNAFIIASLIVGSIWLFFHSKEAQQVEILEYQCNKKGGILRKVGTKSYCVKEDIIKIIKE